MRRTFVGGVITLTERMGTLCREVKAEVLRRVRILDHFNRDNDPHGKHDFVAQKDNRINALGAQCQSLLRHH